MSYLRQARRCALLVTLVAACALAGTIAPLPPASPSHNPFSESATLAPAHHAPAHYIEPHAGSALALLYAEHLVWISSGSSATTTLQLLWDSSSGSGLLDIAPYAVTQAEINALVAASAAHTRELNAAAPFDPKSMDATATATPTFPEPLSAIFFGGGLVAIGIIGRGRRHFRRAIETRDSWPGEDRPAEERSRR